jgi:hypothetical protein
MRADGSTPAMKSYIKTSRFVRPKRAANLDSVTNESSPTSIVADVAVLQSVKIEDVLSNLEQVCDSSTVKWDVLRRMEDREHAIMQGLSSDSDADRVVLDNNHSHENVRIARDPSNGIAQVLSQERQLSHGTDECTGEYESAESCVPIHTANKGSFHMTNGSIGELLMFAVWMMFFIGGLWLSAELRARQRRDPAIICPMSVLPFDV